MIQQWTFSASLPMRKNPLGLMSDSFKRASDAKYLDYHSGQCVLVSAAAMDTLLNGTKPTADCEELDNWLLANRTLNTSALTVLRGLPSVESFLMEANYRSFGLRTQRNIEPGEMVLKLLQRGLKRLKDAFNSVKKGHDLSVV